MRELARRIADNLANVQGRIAAAAARSGRGADSVRLVAATKYVSAETARALVEAGCTNLAESRPQELWSKAAALADLPVHWHLIGHLQRNKLRRTLPLVTLVHSLDSPRLLMAIEDEAAVQGQIVEALVEVNISNDPTKTGLPAAELASLLAQAMDCPHVRVRGLMGMAALEGDLAQARVEFARLRALRERTAAQLGRHLTLDELSMGMSGDYEVAIEEGATMVRIGSALYEGIDHLTGH
jgi:pyridoxal phosphate enzyme (YggS family)